MVARFEWEQDRIISANQAREKSKDINNAWFKSTLLQINDKIDKACSCGLSHCQYNLSDLGDYTQREERVQLVLGRLQNLGYQVKRESGSDQRDNCSWDYLCISW